MKHQPVQQGRARPQHRELRSLPYSSRSLGEVCGFLKSPANRYREDTGDGGLRFVVLIRRLESLTICRCHCKTTISLLFPPLESLLCMPKKTPITQTRSVQWEAIYVFAEAEMEAPSPGVGWVRVEVVGIQSLICFLFSIIYLFINNSNFSGP